MNRLLSILAALLIVTFGHAQKSSQWQRPINNTPKLVLINDKTTNLDAFPLWFLDQYNFSTATRFKFISAEVDQLGLTHTRFQQFLGDIPIAFAIIVAHSKNGFVQSYNGLFFESQEVNLIPEVSSEQALETSLKFVDADHYRWQGPNNNSPLNKSKAFYEDFFPQSEYVILPQTNRAGNIELRPCYKIDVYADFPVSRQEIFVDAITSDILLTNKRIKNIDAVGSGNTIYSGTQTITTDDTGTEFRLRESGRNIETYDMQNGTDYTAAIDFENASNTWDLTGVSRAAIDAHWGSEVTFDYLQEKFSRNSIDNNGMTLKSYVHYGDNFANAFWDGSRMTYGDGNGNNSPLVALDVIAHELAHGLTDFSAGLVYANESGALNESFSDIFGASTEFYAEPTTGDWLIGEDLPNTIRNMENPNALLNPDTYEGNYWEFGFDDNGGVHTNSGVQNYWYYLITDGGSGTNDKGTDYTITGLGLDKSAAIAYRNLTVYLTPTSDYNDARFFSIQSAIDLFGTCSPEVETVTNAWNAVGVGEPYTPTVSAEFEVELSSSCSTPFSVTFENKSQNASGFSWDFGDGSSSIEHSPSHTFTNFGLFTVTLNVDGGSCGLDSIKKLDFIEIDSTIDCVVYMPNDGVGVTQTTCTGKLFDTGGPDENYPDQKDISITIAPSNGSRVLITNLFFDFEEGDDGTCNYDKLYFYDGPNTSSPLLGAFCNTTGIPDHLVSTGNAMTIRQFSDQALNLKGFELDWQCTIPNQKPTADFISDLTEACDGIVKFTDNSSQLPTQFEWDFGDGNSATGFSPTHTYTTTGTYDVQLIATNDVGSDTVLMENYITVTFPKLDLTLGDTVCTNETAQLIAKGVGINIWFDEVTNGDILSATDTFVTPSLSNTTNYYVENQTTFSSLAVGPIDNSFGGGGFFTGDQHQVFDALQDIIIRSVKVYAKGSGLRTVELRNSTGAILQSKSINIPNGESVVPLDFIVPAGTDYQLGTAAGSSPNLFRNNSTPLYPYFLPGYARITGSSATEEGFYYFFYDWRVSKANCSSNREEVQAVVDCLLNANDKISPSILALYPNPASGVITIRLYDFSINNELIITDNQGIPIISQSLQSSEAHIDISALVPGIYHCQIITAQGLIQNTFSVQ